MIYSAVIAGAMVGGVLFLREINKMLGNIGQAGPFLFILLMFAWDGMIVFTAKGYITKESLAVGIVLGTLLKTIAFLKIYNYGKD